MRMKYRLIDNGVIVQEQIKDFDGNEEINAHRIQSDIYDGMDPLHLAMTGQRALWVDAVRISEDCAVTPQKEH